MRYSNTGQREREYLFIDGGCLRATARKICQDIFGNPDEYKPLIKALVGSEYDKIFYYDAVPGQEYTEPIALYEARVQEHHDRFARIRSLDRVHVSLGKIVGVDKRQKGVDVQLAVDMMTHAFRGNMSSATLFAGDADFVPLVNALIAEGLHVTLWHPQQANSDLKLAADNVRLFEFKANYGCFSLNGNDPAFVCQRETTGLNPVQHGLKIKSPGFAGDWWDSTLTLWRQSSSGWSQVVFRVPGATLERAVLTFDSIWSWGIFENGYDWIEIK